MATNEAEDRSGLRHRPLVFVDDLQRPELDPDDEHHLRRVLRVKPGSAITVGDGAGAWRVALLGSTLEPTGEITTEAVTAPRATVGFVPVKGARPEWIVQKLTELGIDEIVPVFSARSVVHWGGSRQDKHLRRMAISARQACLQARRLVLPTIGDPLPLAAFMSANPAAVIADPDGRILHADDTTIVVGPEGGFSGDEVALGPTVALPGHVLRAETAAVVAAAMVSQIRFCR